MAPTRELVDGYANTAEQMLEDAKDTAEDLKDSAVKGVRRVARTAADSVQKTTDYFRNTDLSSLSDDAMSYAKKNPAMAIVAAAAVGFLIGRLVSRD